MTGDFWVINPRSPILVFWPLVSVLPVTHSEKQIGSKFLPLAIGSEVIAVARTMGARCFRSGSWQRSGRPLG